MCGLEFNVAHIDFKVSKFTNNSNFIVLALP